MWCPLPSSMSKSSKLNSWKLREWKVFYFLFPNDMIGGNASSLSQLMGSLLREDMDNPFGLDLNRIFWNIFTIICHFFLFPFLLCKVI